VPLLLRATLQGVMGAFTYEHAIVETTLTVVERDTFKSLAARQVEARRAIAPMGGGWCSVQVGIATAGMFPEWARNVP
jgi:hypothetical protein